MTRISILLALLILLSSCEKSRDDNETLLKFYGDAYEDIGYSITQIDGGYVITGQLTRISRNEGKYISASEKKLGIIKTGNDGNVIWQKMFGDSLVTAVGSKVLALEDGSVICTGYIIDTTTTPMQKDIFVVKVYSDGSKPTEKIFKSTGNQYGTDIIKTKEGFLILGSTDVKREPFTEVTGNTAGKKDILLLRTDNNLQQIVVPFATGFTGNDEGIAVKHDMNGGYIIVGTTDRSEPGQAGNNIILLRVNEDISTTITRILGGTSDEYAADMEVLNNGYFIAGTIGSEVSAQKGYVWGLSDNIFGPPVFEHEIDIDPSSSIKSSLSVKAISRYKTNSFVMSGQSVIGSSARMLIFVTDGEGKYVKEKKKITGGTGTQVAYDVISDDSDNIIAVGKNSFENNSMISLLKFRF